MGFDSGLSMAALRRTFLQTAGKHRFRPRHNIPVACFAVGMLRLFAGQFTLNFFIALFRVKMSGCLLLAACKVTVLCVALRRVLMFADLRQGTDQDAPGQRFTVLILQDFSVFIGKSFGSEAIVVVNVNGIISLSAGQYPLCSGLIARFIIYRQKGIAVLCMLMRFKGAVQNTFRFCHCNRRLHQTDEGAQADGSRKADNNPAHHMLELRPFQKALNIVFIPVTILYLLSVHIRSPPADTLLQKRDLLSSQKTTF